MLICTTDINGHECWTNPPTRNIKEVWEFIYRMFDTYIDSFQFMYGKEVYTNPKRMFKQGELF